MATLISIERADDVVLAPYTQMRERDLVGREGLFIVEGEVTLRVLLARSPMRVRSVLLEERRARALGDVLESLPADTPVYVVPQSVMNEVVGFSIHRGVLALGERGVPRQLDDLLEGASLVVALVGLTNHDNVGGIFRNAAAFGADCVVIDDATCDPLYRKAIRVSAGAALFVPFVRASSPHAMLDAIERAGIEPLALSPRGEATIDGLSAKRYALVLGTEGPGLPSDVIARCRGVRIDMAEGFDSLNVAVASGIALHEARRASAHANLTHERR